MENKTYQIKALLIALILVSTISLGFLYSFTYEDKEQLVKTLKCSFSYVEREVGSSACHPLLRAMNKISGYGN